MCWNEYVLIFFMFFWSRFVKIVDYKLNFFILLFQIFYLLEIFINLILEIFFIFMNLVFFHYVFIFFTRTGGRISSTSQILPTVHINRSPQLPNFFTVWKVHLQLHYFSGSTFHIYIILNFHGIFFCNLFFLNLIFWN